MKLIQFAPHQVSGAWAKAQHSFDQAKGLFEKGSVDKFDVRIPDCGDLQTIRIWHDGSGMWSDWCEEEVRDYMGPCMESSCN